MQRNKETNEYHKTLPIVQHSDCVSICHPLCTVSIGVFDITSVYNSCEEAKHTRTHTHPHYIHSPSQVARTPTKYPTYPKRSIYKK